MPETSRPLTPLVDSRSLSRVHFISLALILVLATLLRLGDFKEPWTQSGWQHMGATFGIMARNYVEQGYLETHLAPATDGVPPVDGKWHLFLHHPVLFPILLSASFHAFGVHEWAARLVPILGSLIELIALFFIVSRLFNPRTGLVAAALIATVPVTAFYGSHVCELGPVVMGFSCLGFLFYLRFIESNQTRDFAAMILFLLIASLNDWPGVYMSGIIGLLLFSRRKKPQAALAFGVVLFVALTHLLIVKLSTGDMSGGRGGSLSHSFVQRSILGGLLNVGGPANALKAIGTHWVTLYTWPVAIAMFLGLSALRPTPFRREIIALILVGLAHTLIFTEGAARHEFWNITMAPFAFVLASAGIVWIVSHIPTKRAEWLLGLSVIALMAYGSWKTISRFDQIENTYFKELGEIIAANTSDKGPVLTSEFPADPMVFYARRKIYGQNDDSKLLPTGLPPSLSPAVAFVIPEIKYKDFAAPKTEILEQLLKNAGYPLNVVSSPALGQVKIFDLTSRE